MTMIPEGKWPARPLAGTLAFTGGDAEQVAVDLEFVGDNEWAGQHRTWYGSFTEKAMSRTFDQLRHCGWKGDDLSDLSGIDGTAEVWVTVTHEDDNEGKVRDRASWINGSPGIAVKKPMNEGDAKAFAERMKGHVLAHSARSKGPSSGTGSKPAALGGKKTAKSKTESQNDFAPDAAATDDIPF